MIANNTTDKATKYSYCKIIKGNYVDIVRASETKTYLPFNKKITIKDKESKENTYIITIAYGINKKGEKHKIISIPTNFIFVFFPTTVETKVNFLVHAPYNTNPSRENIIFNDNINSQITGAVATLVIESLLKIKKLGFLTVDFLALLPLKTEEQQENFPLYQAILESVRNVLQQEEYLPTTKKRKHTSAEQAVLADTKALAKLFTQKDLEHFEKKYFLSTEITDDKTRELRNYLMEKLGIKELKMKDFIEKSYEILPTKKDDWLKEFYKNIKRKEDLELVKNYPIIRLSTNKMICPNPEEVFLPAGKKKFYFPTVKKCFAEDKNTSSFLTKDLGLKKVDIKDEIKKILKKYQGKINITLGDYKEDLKFIVEQWANKKDTVENLFKEEKEITSFVRCKEGDKFYLYDPKYFDCYFPAENLESNRTKEIIFVDEQFLKEEKYKNFFQSNKRKRVR